MHSIPDKIYDKQTQKKIKKSEKEALAKIFVDLARNNPDLAIAIIATIHKTRIKKMLDVSGNITDKVIITLFSSGGFRPDTWIHFTWKDLKLFQNEDGIYKEGDRDTLIIKPDTVTL